MNSLSKTFMISAAGMRVQGERLRVVSENLANANSTATTPGGDPYRRKTVTFESVFDRALGANSVRIARFGTDQGEFQRKYEPGHPSADSSGYVAMPNVNGMVEMVDMREAQRSYEANLRVLETSKSMLSRTIALLRG